MYLKHQFSQFMKINAAFTHFKVGYTKCKEIMKRTHWALCWVFWVLTTSKQSISSAPPIPSPFKCTIDNGFGHLKRLWSDTLWNFQYTMILLWWGFKQCYLLSVSLSPPSRHESYCFDHCGHRGIFRKSYANIMGTQGWFRDTHHAMYIH